MNRFNEFDIIIDSIKENKRNEMGTLQFRGANYKVLFIRSNYAPPGYFTSNAPALATRCITLLARDG